MKKIALLCATTAFVLPSMAFAQSTGSVDFEEEANVVVTGTRTQEVGGVTAPDTTKAKASLTSEVIARQNPGQTILDTINLIPGVSFQNNDAYGSSGGTLNIRGFSADRVSLTVDGVPLNDSGNYAIFSNQQVDPELIGEVNVSLGATDVDSPTASAAGGTVNYRTIVPRERFGVLVSGSLGQFDFRRLFGVIDTGSLTSWGTRAFVSASTAKNDNPFNNYGRVDKQQYNARLYQPLGTHGDFVSVAVNYNQNRNNFFGSLPLRNDTTRTLGAIQVPRIVGGLAQNRYPANAHEREYLINFPCTVDAAQAGVADAPAPSTRPDGTADTNGDYGSCGTEFDRRFNPSNTGNIRGSSRFTFGQFTLTVDPSFQYVKANGGGTVTGNEGAVRDINPLDPDGAGPEAATATPAQCRAAPNAPGRTCVAGYLGGTPFFGRDVNGDGDTLDTVTVLAPSQTQTNRYGLIAGVRWDINDDHAVRAGYTFDRARHRQTGEVGLLDTGGSPLDVFPINDPQLDGNGVALEKRDRLSYAILHQFWGEYRGEFMDGRLVLNAGLRLPFFKRDLNNFCFTSSAGGFVECFGRGDPRNATYATLNPTIQGPQQRVFKYDAILPNVGFTYDFVPRLSVFANYAKGLSVPGTDNLYNSFFFAPNTDAANPNPERTDNFDLGLRYRGPRVQAQLGAFYNRYSDRTASAFDPELNVSIFRNLGRVDKYGLDGYISYQPIEQLNLYLFGSILKSEIKDDLITGECTAAQVAGGFPGCTVAGAPIFALTAGRRESGAATYTLGGTVRGTWGPIEIGLTAKRTGPRYIYDTNEPVRAFVGAGAGVDSVVFPARAPAYWLFNLDARLSLARLLERSYIQFNAYNLFNQFYVGGFGGGLNQSITRNNSGVITAYGAPPFVQIGAPRTISATLVVGF
jgi:iron complex outermembrane receptor protein